MRSLVRLLKKGAGLFGDRRKKLELLIGLAVYLVLAVAFSAGAFEPLERLSLDGRFLLRGERHFRADVALVLVDEESLDVFGRWPWPRDKHVPLLRFLNYDFSRPRVLAWDVLFESPDLLAPEADEEFVLRAAEFRSSLLMTYFFEWGHVSPFERNLNKEKRLRDFAIPQSINFPPSVNYADKASIPFSGLAEVTDLGFVNDVTDSDGRTRRLPLLYGFEGRLYPSFALLAAMRYLGAGIEDLSLDLKHIIIRKDGRVLRKIPVTPQGELLINFYGRADGIPHYSFIQLLKRDSDWQKGGRLPEELRFLRDKIALVGVSALGLKDRKVTPFFSYDPGVSVQAQAIANILDQTYLVRLPRSLSNVLFLVIGLMAIFATMFLRITRSLCAVAGLIAAYALTAFFFFLRGYWMDFAAFGIMIIAVFIAITSFRYFTALEELKRTQAQLIHSVKMASLGQLSAGIAHEFRNILNAVNMHVEFAGLAGTPPEKVKEGLVKIKGIMANAGRILNGLLTFARKNESLKKPGELKKTIEETLLLVEKEMMRHGIRLSSELDDVPEMNYDAGQISQVIMNLINNGRDALREKEDKSIAVRLKNTPDGAQIDIQDNGCGIPPEIMKRLFEPFVTSKPSGQGTGLGLSVCHGIIRNHGGEIKVTSVPRQGTTWHIFLPR